ncbi:hypothetical protein OF83DRAFT_1123762 [Amylostereum chailletii]|nr:hypothetical protein OF83DRAFT_1123762 [Amylostereum chailletii]
MPTLEPIRDPRQIQSTGQDGGIHIPVRTLIHFISSNAHRRLAHARASTRRRPHRRPTHRSISIQPSDGITSAYQVREFTSRDRPPTPSHLNLSPNPNPAPPDKSERVIFKSQRLTLASAQWPRRPPSLLRPGTEAKPPSRPVSSPGARVSLSRLLQPPTVDLAPEGPRGLRVARAEGLDANRLARQPQSPCSFRTENLIYCEVSPPPSLLPGAFNVERKETHGRSSQDSLRPPKSVGPESRHELVLR